MAIGNKKSKMGPMSAVDLNSIQQNQAEPMSVEEAKQSEAKPINKESAPISATPKAKSSVENPPTVGGRPKFELIAGDSEIKVNFHCPQQLYELFRKISYEQKKSIKQVICEMLLEQATSKHGFKVE